MRRGHGIAPALLAIAIALPPVLNLVSELRRASQGGPFPEARSFGFGEAPAELAHPHLRGRYVPARTIDFRSPSSFRSTFFVHYPKAERVLRGAVVIAPTRVLAGRVVKVWRQAGVALVRWLEDPSFRVGARCRGQQFLLAGCGDGSGMEPIAGSIAGIDGDAVRTSGADGVFPADLLVGYVRKDGGERVKPSHSLEGTGWVQLWYDPDLEALEQALGSQAGEP